MSSRTALPNGNRNGCRDGNVFVVNDTTRASTAANAVRTSTAATCHDKRLHFGYSSWY
jgi:hypothetical protein